MTTAQRYSWCRLLKLQTRNKTRTTPWTGLQLIANVSQPVRQKRFARLEKCVPVPIWEEPTRLANAVIVTWRIGAVFATRYFRSAYMWFERVFDTNDECDAICKELRRNSIDDICNLWVNGIYVTSVTRITQVTKMPFLSNNTQWNHDKTKWKWRELEDEVCQVSLPLWHYGRVWSGIFLDSSPPTLRLFILINKQLFISYYM